MITIKNLAKAYNGDNVISDISLDIEPGKIYGLVGSNGAGKSTLLKCMTGVYRPDSGQVLLDEKEIYDNGECKAKIGFMYDTPVFIASMLVKSYFKYYKKYFEDASWERFIELCDMFGLDLKKGTESLSLGQKKKLQIALNLSRNIEYLVMDEAENGLDNESREQFRNIIRDQADLGVGVIISSHDLSNIENMCDEIIMIDRGRVIYNQNIDSAMSSLHKWRIKSDKQDLKLQDFMIVEELGNIITVLTDMDNAKSRSILEAHGVEIIEQMKVNLSDVYKYLHKEV
ncbi:MAG: ABC transporter ATP-binding protein [Lachnospiraceae bacterium]|nr:ABC transporter ATP-binding protein [Lachnospiraceae bacterium]